VRRLHLPNLTLITLAAGYFVLPGALFLALATAASTVSMALPRWLTILLPARVLALELIAA
jgi:hypothetical protein